jgi:hypothetical protein
MPAKKRAKAVARVKKNRSVRQTVAAKVTSKVNPRASRQMGEPTKYAARQRALMASPKKGGAEVPSSPSKTSKRVSDFRSRNVHGTSPSMRAGYGSTTRKKKK